MKKNSYKKAAAVSLAAVLSVTQTAPSVYASIEEGAPSNENAIMPITDTLLTTDTAKTEADYQLAIDAADVEHEISDTLFGAFIEDINFAADGGLYAEMVKNRSFEYDALAVNGAKNGWKDVGTVTAQVQSEGGLNANNTHYIKITNTTGTEAGISNGGFLDGMSIVSGSAYNFSVWAKGDTDLTVNLKAGEQTAATAKIDKLTDQWSKYELTLNPTVTANKDVKLEVLAGKGTVDVDMVSLFPDDTYKGRKNGLRKDLAQLVEELNPSFLRFPGGCIIEGVSLDKAYDWKDSIGCDEKGRPYEFNGTYGDVAARPLGQDIWADEGRRVEEPYYMTYGLGFFEYFQFAEDIGAIGVPVINCGKCCQGQSNGASVALDSEEMKKYIQDALDLVEFCRGDETTTWGKVRIAMGHKEPFQLKYVGIGNEQWGSDFYEHYEAFVEAFAQAAKDDPKMYGDIELSFTSGVDDGVDDKSNYPAAYRRVSQWLGQNQGKTVTDYAGVIDHHYYNPPQWFFAHNDYYDEENYSRDAANMTTAAYGGAIPVFLGEYAAQSNHLLAAIAEASYMTALERNGDIVKMAAYAPLFGNTTLTQWTPDLIWFNNTDSWGSVNYYVQKLFGSHAGTKYLASKLSGNHDNNNLVEVDLQGKIGLGTWNTSAEFDNLMITNNETGEVLASQDFESNTISQWEPLEGDWKIKDGKLVQTSMNTLINNGTTAYFGDVDWKNYTITVEATKTDGKEGFLIPFAVDSAEHSLFWNFGGWNNTRSCIQEIVGGTNGTRAVLMDRSGSVITGHKYQLKVVVEGSSVKCYVDGELHLSYEPAMQTNDIYHSVSADDNGDIIVKLVNATDKQKTVHTSLYNVESVEPQAEVYELSGTDLKANNTEEQQDLFGIKESKLDISENFNCTIPAYSVSVIRIHAKAAAKSDGTALAGIDDTLSQIVQEGESIAARTTIGAEIAGDMPVQAATLYAGGTTKKTTTIAHILPEGVKEVSALSGAENEAAITYTSMDNSVAAADTNGKVTAKGKGSTYVKVTVNGSDGSKMAHLYQVTVKKASLKVKAKKNVTVGKKISLTTKLNGYKASDLKWSVKNKKIAKVSPATGKKTVKITGVKKGKTTVTVKAGKTSAKTTITVKAAKKK